MPEGQNFPIFDLLWFTATLEKVHFAFSYSVLDMQGLSIFGIATNYSQVMEALDSPKRNYLVYNTLQDIIRGDQRRIFGGIRPGIRLVKSRHVRTSDYKYFVLVASYNPDYRKAHKAIFVVDSFLDFFRYS
jgi:hypothetical protein